MDKQLTDVEALIAEFEKAAIALHVCSGLPKDDSWYVRALSKYELAKANLIRAIS